MPDIIACGRCQEKFDYLLQPEIAMGAIKCPYCGCVLNQNGIVLANSEKD